MPAPDEGALLACRWRGAPNVRLGLLLLLSGHRGPRPSLTGHFHPPPVHPAQTGLLVYSVTRAVALPPRWMCVLDQGTLVPLPTPLQECHPLLPSGQLGEGSV